MYGIIYKATNLVNGKVYIGLTKQELAKRRYQHELTASKKSNRSYYFHDAIHKHGKDQFSWEVIDRAETHDELREKEMFWVTYYGSYGKNGYNLTPGGEDTSNAFKEVYVFTFEGELIKTYESATEASVAYRCAPGDIGRVANGKTHARNHHVLLYADDWDSIQEMQKEVQRRVDKVKEHQKRSGGKSIVVFDRALNVYKFRSIYAAAKKVGVKRETIKVYLSGKRIGTKEWAFFYKEELPSNFEEDDSFLECVQKHFAHMNRPAYIPHPKTKKTLPSQSTLYQYTLNGELIRSYQDVFEVVETLNISKASYSNIFQCSKGVKRMAFGFLWLMESDYPDEKQREKIVQERVKKYLSTEKRRSPIIAILPSGEPMRFENKISCAKALKMSRKTIANKIKNGEPSADGTLFYEECDYTTKQKAM